MRAATVIFFIAGLVLITGLIAWRGVGALLEVLAVAGWQLLWLPLFYLVPLLLAGESWRLLFPRNDAPGPIATTYGSWVSAAINELLPVAQIGGEVVKARLIVLQGARISLTAASVVVDKTIQALGILLFALVGLGFFALRETGGGAMPRVLIFIALLGAAIYGLYRAQQAGIFALLVRLAQRFGWSRLAGSVSEGAEKVDSEIREVYARRGRFFAACAWRLLFRLFMAGEVWLALYFLGHPISLIDAVILESLAQIVVAIGFVVPAALGVLEGGFMFLGVALGLSPDVALALALARRARQLLSGVPALLVWQATEGWSFARRRARQTR